jgi:SWI/SNF-related matrix-associated actin-dependent regulator of chromatin subfamily A3
MAGSKNKRTYEVIDLTSDNENTGPPQKASRTSSSIMPGLSSSQPSRSGFPSSSQSKGFLSSQTTAPQLSQSSQAIYDELYGGEDFDEEADTSDRFDSYILSLQQYGSMASKIVGCRYYNGYITQGESVLLIREP